MCACLQCEIEGAIHANFSDWDVLLIYASNAYNLLNRISMFLYVRNLWPHCARFVSNTYRGWPVLVMCGMLDFILSREALPKEILCSFMFMQLAPHI